MSILFCVEGLSGRHDEGGPADILPWSAACLGKDAGENGCRWSIAGHHQETNRIVGQKCRVARCRGKHEQVSSFFFVTTVPTFKTQRVVHAESNLFYGMGL